MVTGFNHLAEKIGVSLTLIPMLLRARKWTSYKIYHRSWKVYFVWCEARMFHLRQYGMYHVLFLIWAGASFGLQHPEGSSLDIGLSLSETVGHSFPEKVMTHIAPRLCSLVSPWDLRLFLSALLKLPYEPIEIFPWLTLPVRCFFSWLSHRQSFRTGGLIL